MYRPVLIVSIGNPGQEYARTAHSAGHRVLNTLHRDILQPRFSHLPFITGPSTSAASVAFPTTIAGSLRDHGAVLSRVRDRHDREQDDRRARLAKLVQMAEDQKFAKAVRQGKVSPDGGAPTKRVPRSAANLVPGVLELSNLPLGDRGLYSKLRVGPGMDPLSPVYKAMFGKFVRPVAGGAATDPEANPALDSLLTGGGGHGSGDRRAGQKKTNRRPRTKPEAGLARFAGHFAHPARADFATTAFHPMQFWSLFRSGAFMNLSGPEVWNAWAAWVEGLSGVYVSALAHHDPQFAGTGVPSGDPAGAGPGPGAGAVSGFPFSNIHPPLPPALVILHDELELEVGEFEMRPGESSSRGHKGLESIVESMPQYMHSSFVTNYLAQVRKHRQAVAAAEAREAAEDAEAEEDAESESESESGSYPYAGAHRHAPAQPFSSLNPHGPAPTTFNSTDTPVTTLTSATTSASASAGSTPSPDSHHVPDNLNRLTAIARGVLPLGLAAPMHGLPNKLGNRKRGRLTKKQMKAISAATAPAPVFHPPMVYKFGIGIGRPESRDRGAVAAHVLAKLGRAETEGVERMADVIANECMKISRAEV